MALNEPRQGSDTRIGVDETEEVELESELRDMSEKILHYRSSLPEKLKSKLTSIFVAQRPVCPETSEPGTSRDPNPDLRQVDANMPLEGDQETLEKIRLLKEKVSSNATAMPILLKRLGECVSKIEKMESQKLNIHPAFKRKRIG